MTSTVNSADVGIRNATLWANNGDAGAAAATNGTAAGALEELRQFAVQYAGTNPGSGAAAGGNNIVNGAGAPAIDGVTIDLSAEDMAAALLVLQGKTQEAQLKTAKEGLEVNRVKQKNAHESAMKKLDDWVKKSRAAAAKQKALGIFGWIAKAVAFIASAIATVVAAVATVATAGAAAPLLAVATLALVASGMSLASGISQAAGGPPLELSSLMVKACTAILKGLGVPEEKLEGASKIMAGAVAMLVCPATIAVDPALFGNMFGGITQLASDDPTKAAIVTAVFSAVAAVGVGIAMAVLSGGGSAGNMLGETMKSVTRITQGVTGAIQGANTATQGGLNVGIAIDEHNASMAQVDKKKLDAIMLKLQQQMQEDRDEIKKIVEEIQQGVSLVSQMINAAGESRSQISANLGKSMA